MLPAKTRRRTRRTRNAKRVPRKEPAGQRAKEGEGEGGGEGNRDDNVSQWAPSLAPLFSRYFYTTPSPPPPSAGVSFPLTVKKLFHWIPVSGAIRTRVHLISLLLFFPFLRPLRIDALDPMQNTIFLIESGNSLGEWRVLLFRFPFKN